jgi:hypothetical protein
MAHESHLRGQFAHIRTRPSHAAPRSIGVRRIHKSARRGNETRGPSARRGSRIAPARTIPHTSAHDRRTQHQERRASARRGFVNRVRNGNAVDFGASNPHAECIPRGAYAPRSCFAVRTSADEKTIFAIHIRTSGQERRASARRGSRIAPARTIPRTSAHDRRTQRQERRASARRGSTNRTCEDNSAHIRTRPSHAAPRAAGVSPPWSENRTCEDNSAHIRTRPSHAAPRAAGVSPPWKRNALAGRFDLRSANNATKSGAHQPAVAHETHLQCSSIYFWQTTPPAKTAVRPPRFDQLNAACGVSETHMRERFVPHGRLTPTALGRDDG